MPTKDEKRPTDHELSQNEVRVLLALKESGHGSLEQVMKKGGFSKQVEVMNAASWLASKGLIELEESKTKMISLAQHKFGQKDLPERRAIKILKKNDGLISVDELKAHPKMGGQLNIAMGWLKKKGWADFIKDQGVAYLSLTEKGRAAMDKKEEDEETLERLGKGDLEDKDIPEKALNWLRSRKEIIKEKETVARSLKLTNDGRELLDAGLKLVDQVSQLTPELIQSGQWKRVELRPYDIHTFAPGISGGKAHPLANLIEEIRSIFFGMGFTELEGDFVESCFWNMDALFIPQDHPARELQDTFYVEKGPDGPVADKRTMDTIKEVHESGGKTGSAGWGYKWDIKDSQNYILRTHTTVNTIRYLADNPEPPARIFLIGKVFRNETLDSTHLPEFYQIEGIVLEEDASFRMLLGLLKEFYKRIGFPKIRLRPSYYPYTEPSMDVEAKFQGKWIELGGSGIFRPEVTLPLGIKHPVLAWGLGLERLAMLRFGLDDIRDLYISDIKWLRESPLR